MKMYAVKCDQLYLKDDKENGIILVPIQKASVFTLPDKAYDLKKRSSKMEYKDKIRVVELEILEKELD